jgi:hypothetical protein
MSKELIKNIGLGVVALLVVCNTVSISKLSHSNHRSSGYAKKALVENARSRGPRMGSRSSEGRGSWRQGQSSHEKGSRKGKGDK